MKLFRWKAIVPLALVVVALAIGGILLLDPLVKWGIETAGTAIVGAKVDVASVDVRPFKGLVTIRGLEVTDPSQPMTNLVSADQLVAQLRFAPLLERKVGIDTLAARGVLFGTPRKTSGAVAHPSESSGLAMRTVKQWSSGMHLPTLSLSGLGSAVDVQAISADSLTTLRRARAIKTTADSARTALIASVTALDPRSQVDSAVALANRLKNANLRTLGLAGARDAAAGVRKTIDSLTAVDGKLRALQTQANDGIGRLRSGVTGLDSAKEADYAYARGLLKLPAFAAPDIGPAIFGRMVTERIAPILYWLDLAQQYAPPGVKARLHPGPRRVRESGTDVVFPREHTDPTFLLEFGEASLTLNGTGAAAGAYTARVNGLTTEPAVYGRPTTFAVSRTGAATGPESIRAAGVLDHVRAPIRDSVDVSADGVTLPTIPINALGATLQLGSGTTRLALSRVGDSLNGSWLWHASDVKWARQSSAADAGGVSGAAGEFVWNAVSGLRDVEVEARVSGPVSGPRLAISTNVATAVSQALQKELGQQVKVAQAAVRARVDSLVAPQVAAARSAIDSVQSVAGKQIDDQRAKIADVKAQLEARLKGLVGFSIGAP